MRLDGLGHEAHAAAIGTRNGGGEELQADRFTGNKHWLFSGGDERAAAQDNRAQKQHQHNAKAFHSSIPSWKGNEI
jgi:hypothetical protein